ncbi:hypothetical protein ABH14_30305 [Brevibacillus brevis]|nr:hypothetical protein [Brevibacillus brevis]
MIDDKSASEVLVLSIKEFIKREYSLIENRLKEESINHRLAVYLEGIDRILLMSSRALKPRESAGLSRILCKLNQPIYEKVSSP